MLQPHWFVFFTIVLINLCRVNSFTGGKLLLQNAHSTVRSRVSYQQDSRVILHAAINEEYRDPLTKVLGTFINKENLDDNISTIDWKMSKRKKTSLQSLAKTLETELTKKEWFVNGNVDPSFFSDDFTFQDPDVKIKGIEEYARGVNKIFSQKNSRAEIVAVRENKEALNTLTVTWRLSGSVNLGFGVTIKPFVVFTDFLVNPSDGLIVFQEDRFSLPGSDIVLSAFFPFLITKYLLPPAQPVGILRSDFLKEEAELRILSKPAGGSIFSNFFNGIKKK